MITEKQVIDSYTHVLRLQQRRMQIEAKLQDETPLQADERIGAQSDHANLELRYLAQYT